MVRLKTQNKKAKPDPSAKGLEATEILTQDFGSFTFYLLVLPMLFSCFAIFSSKTRHSTEDWTPESNSCNDWSTNEDFFFGFVGHSLPQNPAASDKVNKIYKTNFFIFVLAHLKSSLSRYTPHSYDTNVQSLLPSKYLFCLCIHAPWSKTDEPLEIRNV